MGKEIIAFGNIEVEKHKSHQRKSPILIYDGNFDITVVSSRLLFGGRKCFKFFIRFKDGKNVIHL